MNTVREYHDEAMRLAQFAVLARHDREWDKAVALAREAYVLESKAAELIPEEKASEPTRSILYRSAASLAFQCKEFSEAQRLVAKGLSGYPPPSIESELKWIYEQVKFERHLLTKGLTVQEGELHLYLEGEAVSKGMVPFKEFYERMTVVPSLLKRTVARLMNLTYQRAGRPRKREKAFVAMLSTPQEGSFAVTLRLATPTGEQMLLYPTAFDVIEEIATGLELLDKGDEEALEERIGSEEYRINFVAAARTLAPDGERIRYVGLRTSTRTIHLRRSQEEIPVVFRSELPELLEGPVAVTVEGILDYAKARGEEVLGVTDDDGKEHLIKDVKGLDDLVISMWRQRVVVSGTSDGKFIYPTHIGRAEE